MQTENLHHQLVILGTSILESQIPWDVVVVDGSPVESILGRVKKNWIDFVVMGSHQRGVFGRFWMGSVSESVVHHIPCPTLIARGTSDVHPRLQRILCPTNDSIPECVDIATDLASSDDGLLYFLETVGEIYEL